MRKSAGALAWVSDPDGVFATKGGIAMELRLGDRARATRDVDITDVDEAVRGVRSFIERITAA